MEDLSLLVISKISHHLNIDDLNDLSLVSKRLRQLTKPKKEKRRKRMKEMMLRARKEVLKPRIVVQNFTNLDIIKCDFDLILDKKGNLWEWDEDNIWLLKSKIMNYIYIEEVGLVLLNFDGEVKVYDSTFDIDLSHERRLKIPEGVKDIVSIEAEIKQEFFEINVVTVKEKTISWYYDTINYGDPFLK